MNRNVAKGRRALAWRPIAFVLLPLFLLGGCQSAGPEQEVSPQPHVERDLLTREEILNSTARTGDLLQAIQSLRPQFLARPRNVYNRASTAAAPLMIYIERIRQSGPEVLRSISANKVLEVRYLDPVASQNQFGLSASGGALVIKLYQPDNPHG